MDSIVFEARVSHCHVSSMCLKDGNPSSPAESAVVKEDESGMGDGGPLLCLSRKGILRKGYPPHASHAFPGPGQEENCLPSLLDATVSL
jgi:hypothetical protein